MRSSLKYSALCALLGFTDGFESTSEGIHLQEEHIARIDAALTAYKQLQANFKMPQTEAAASGANLLSLQSGNAKATVDNINNSKENILPSYLDPNNPSNQYVDSILGFNG